MTKDKHARYLKRKAKLVQRTGIRAEAAVKPYEGSKYQADQWAPLVCATEAAVYDTILMTERRLKNAAVKKAFAELALRLHRGVSPTLKPDEVRPPLTIGDESEFIVWMVRNNWTRFFEGNEEVPAADLIGILRTLLNSINAHQWNSGPNHGYVAFLQDFMEGRPAGGKVGVLADDDDVQGLRIFDLD